MNIYTNSDNNQDIRSKAANIAEGSGVAGIQAAIDTASDGETIVIPPGSYSGSIATPIRQGLSGNRGGAATCFIQIENKKITLKGVGAMFFGEGHDQPNVEPYSSRAGVCVYDSQVTFDGVRIKEFQGRAMIVYNSQIIYKNGIVDGNDGGGISMLGNSTGIFVNNMFAEMNFGGIMLWQNSQAKIINNIFYNAAVLYFYHPGTNDQARADIINNIFSEIKSDIAQVSWWKAEPAQLKLSKLSYNLVYRAKDFVCDPVFELWCDDFPGKITADPLFMEPVTDTRGIAAWANFGFKDGSPALNVGDPQIPGPKNLGNAGGPCTDGNSSVCLDFISKEKNDLKPPPSPTIIVPSIDYPTSQPTTSFLQPTSSAQPTSGSLKPIISEEPPISYYLPPTIPINNPSNTGNPQPSEEPPISYYMPPTIPNNNPPNQIGNPQPSNGNQPATETTPINTPTPEPSKAPIIDVKKTVTNVRNSLKTFISNVITFTQNILP